MITSIRLKILASFLLLVLLLAMAGAISIAEFRRLSSSFGELIDDNYKSIEASRTMLDALEREDSAVLLIMLGEEDEGYSIIKSSDASFLKALEIAQNNITEENEGFYINEIRENYGAFRSNWLDTTDRDYSISWYYEKVHNDFRETKEAIDSLMSLNQNSMYKEAAQLGERSARSMMPGIIAIVSAVVFSIMLNFFITRYFVKPICSLARAVNQYQEGDVELRTNIRSKDEIKALEKAINNLLLRLNK